MNVTDLRMVGNAHPTIDKGFWRSPNAYFSAIQPKMGCSSISAALHYRLRTYLAPLSLPVMARGGRGFPRFMLSFECVGAG
ncbi:hypothetical protein [Coleofasciculus sp.]|uniref:hypothetical protein n=1 Tax=Coleofasciculus sp. TaxID=3100458 RepID=UPI003A4536DC